MWYLSEVVLDIPQVEQGTQMGAQKVDSGACSLNGQHACSQWKDCSEVVMRPELSLQSYLRTACPGCTAAGQGEEKSKRSTHKPEKEIPYFQITFYAPYC